MQLCLTFVSVSDVLNNLFEILERIISSKWSPFCLIKKKHKRRKKHETKKGWKKFADTEKVLRFENEKLLSLNYHGIYQKTIFIVHLLLPLQWQREQAEGWERKKIHCANSICGRRFHFCKSFFDFCFCVNLTTKLVYNSLKDYKNP